MFSGKTSLKRPWPLLAGSTGSRIRELAWDDTSIGPIESWHGNIKAAIDCMLHMPSPALLLVGPTCIMLYNDRCASVLEEAHARLLGTRLDAGWPSLGATAREAITQALAGKATAMQDVELTLPHPPGSQCLIVDLDITPIVDDQAQGLAVLIVLHDVTRHFKAERSSQRHAMQMSAIFDRAQVGLSEISLTGGFLRVNDELCRMLGRSRDTLLQLGVLDVTHPDDVPHSLEAVGKLIEDGQPVSLDKRYVQPDGKIVWANSSISRLDPVTRGGSYSLLAVTVNLTERTLAKQALAESEARFRALAEASPALIWLLDTHGNAVYLNPQCQAMFGAKEKLLGNSWRSVLHEEDADAYLAAFRSAQEAREPFKGRTRVHAQDGSVRWIKSFTAPWFRSDGKYAGHVGTSVDITEIVTTQEQLLIANDRLNLAIDGSGDGVWDWNIVIDEITHSERMNQIFGFSSDDDFGTLDKWQRRIHPDDLPHVLSALHDCLEGITPTYSAEYRMRCKNGMWKWILSRAIVVGRDDQKRPLRMTGTVTDISDERQSKEVIWLHANFDALTGLPNRRLFRDRLVHEVKAAHRTGARLGLLFIDLDHFKEANDLLGHDVGDQLLAQAASRILSCVRQSDTVARLGGDEFTAILTQLGDAFDAEHIARKINDTLVQPFFLGQEVVHLSASIGITLYPTDGTEPEALIRNADQAMYVAKSSGRNQFNYFTPAMQHRAQERLRLIADLRGALAANELVVHYQPVVELRSGRIVKAEALLRWNHPRLGFLMPADFIPFAEETGLISEIGDWVFQEAAACSRRCRILAGDTFQISVNRSPVQFMARPDGSNWPSYLTDLNVPGQGMSVEITEAVLLKASPRVTQQLQQYHDAGMQVAIDDFGTGYSSLAYLKRFEIDYLKIDQTFIRDMHENEDDRAIVRSVTAMAHELGLQVIAEGIETAQQNALVIAAGCDFAQGFHYSRPVAMAQFEHLLNAGLDAEITVPDIR